MDFTQNQSVDHNPPPFCFVLLPTMDACKSKVNCRSYVIPSNFGFGLYFVRCLLRHRSGRHLASCVFVVKKEHCDF